MVDNVSGNPVNNRTMEMLREAEAISGVHITIIQGKNPGGVTASAGTHDGWGVVDIRIRDYDLASRTNLCHNLRIVGFAAWIRTTAQGFSGDHIHAVAIGDPGISPSAANQVVAYKNGHNGLANNGTDDGPRIPIVTWEQYIISIGGITVAAVDDLKKAIQDLTAKVDSVIAKEGQDLSVDTSHQQQDAGRYSRDEEWFKEFSNKLDTIIANTTKA